MPMNPEFPRKLVALMREHLRLQADLRTLASILTVAEMQERPPYEWLEALKLMREQPEYQNIAQEHEQLFRSVENAADVEECQRLLETMPSTQFPN